MQSPGLKIRHSFLSINRNIFESSSSLMSTLTSPCLHNFLSVITTFPVMACAMSLSSKSVQSFISRSNQTLDVLPQNPSYLLLSRKRIIVGELPLNLHGILVDLIEKASHPWIKKDFFFQKVLLFGVGLT